MPVSVHEIGDKLTPYGQLMRSAVSPVSFIIYRGKVIYLAWKLSPVLMRNISLSIYDAALSVADITVSGDARA